MLAELGATTFRETYGAANELGNMESYLASSFSTDTLAKELTDPKSAYLLAQVREQSLGYAKLRAGEVPECVTLQPSIELERIYVLQQAKGKGIGSALMQACLDTAAQNGYRAVWLGVWQRNQAAIGFYQKWHFKKTGEKIFMLGADAQCDWVMLRQL